jgi:hypothetical protein
MKELLQPELNKQLNSQSDYEIKTLIIQAYPQHRKKSMRMVLHILAIRLIHKHSICILNFKKNYFKIF